jgi:hypothetical protein
VQEAPQEKQKRLALALQSRVARCPSRASVGSRQGGTWVLGTQQLGNGGGQQRQSQQETR